MKKYFTAILGLIATCGISHAVLIAHWPLIADTSGNDGVEGVTFSASPETFGNTDYQDAVKQSGGSWTWRNDATRGIVAENDDNGRFTLGTQNIDLTATGSDYAWSLWVEIDSTNFTDPGADVVIGSRNGVWNKFQPTGMQRWANISGYNIADDNWHHVVIQGEIGAVAPTGNNPAGSRVSLFIDGAFVGSQSNFFGTPDVLVVNNIFELGGSSGFSEDASGRYSDVAVWNDALTADEIISYVDVSDGSEFTIFADGFQALRTAHDAGSGQVIAGPVRWTYASGLVGAAGLSPGIEPGEFTLILNSGAGTGFMGVAIPEPGTYALVGLALLAFIGYRRRMVQ